MFLTRLGNNSRAVITGDITQIDLSHGKARLIEAAKALKDVKGLEFVYLTHKDVVRHQLVMRIIEAYGEYEKKKEKGTEKDLTKRD